MRSVRSQFGFFALALMFVVACGGYAYYIFFKQAETAEQRQQLLAKAFDSHLAGTFFNEEGRAILHGVLGLYAYPANERKPLYEKLKIYNNDPKAAVGTYATRAQDAIKENLARPLAPGFKENFEKHLAAFQAYHAEMFKVLDNPPDSREKFADAISSLNVLRSQIGGLRRVNSDALTKALNEANVERDIANNRQKSVLLGTFIGIGAVLAIFMMIMLRQFNSFSSTIAKALDDFKANRAVTVDLSKAAQFAEFKAVSSTLQEMQRQAEALSEVRSREASDLEVRAERAASLDYEMRTFEQSISSVVHAMQSNAEVLGTAAHELHKTTSAASDGSASLTNSSRSTDEAVTTMATAMTEMSQSIESLGAQLSQTLDAIGKASSVASETNASVEKLDGSAHKIGEVVSLIRSIAEQTNLLALNATIEAARAGESGRGFAVVANEVKSLATRTSQATEEIAAQIAAIQQTTTVSVTAIRTISSAVELAAVRTQDMAAVLHQQDSAIRSVAQSAEISKLQTNKMQRQTQEIAQWILEADQSAKSVDQISGELNKASQNIDAAVKQFLGRAAA